MPVALAADARQDRRPPVDPQRQKVADLRATQSDSQKIVRPHVGEAKYIELRSRYYSMRTTAEFRLLHKEVIDAAKSQGKKLPAYAPL